MARKMTAEQRRAEAEALHAGIANQVNALRSSEEWHRFLDFTRSFHSYSLNNVLLILAQRPTASAVAGYRQWQAKGRQVRKGEKAIRIFGYSTKKITQEDPDTGEEVEKRIPRFP
ncbi:MAG TPA: ArdC family protein, partial [Jiangellaceae bacterium]|nr:ArdC family protein [Jiangellaceae bacterium]